jgi:hypothetical protein
VLDEARRISFMLWITLFEKGGEGEVEWMVKEGGVRSMIRRVREKKERNSYVMYFTCWAAGAFLRPWLGGIRRVRKEWKGKKEWREVMWMMEEEGGIDSMCGMKEADGGSVAKEVLKALGICCPK